MGMILTLKYQHQLCCTLIRKTSDQSCKMKARLLKWEQCCPITKTWLLFDQYLAQVCTATIRQWKRHYFIPCSLFFCNCSLSKKKQRQRSDRSNWRGCSWTPNGKATIEVPWRFSRELHAMIICSALNPDALALFMASIARPVHPLSFCLPSVLLVHWQFVPSMGCCPLYT